jgi:hypothetical protein
VQALAFRGKSAFASRRLGTVLEAVAEPYGADRDAAGDDEAGIGGDPRGDRAQDADVPVYATSAEYLKLEVHGAPTGLRGAFRCRVAADPARVRHGSGSDLIAKYMELI